MLACLARGEVFTCSVHSVSLQLFAHLASCPCLTALVLVLGLLARVEVLGRLKPGGLLGRLALGLGLGELLGRLTLDELLTQLVPLHVEPLEHLAFCTLLVPLARLAVLENLGLLACVELVEYLAFGELIERLAIGGRPLFSKLIDSLHLVGLGLRGSRAQIVLLESAQGLGLRGEDGDGVGGGRLKRCLPALGELLARLVLELLEHARHLESCGRGGDEVGVLELHGLPQGDRLGRDRLTRVHLDEHIVV